MKTNKHTPIAETISELLKKKFNHDAHYQLDIEKEWLPLIPVKKAYKDKWEIISEIYCELVDRKWTLEHALETKKQEIKQIYQKVDIFYAAPYNFILEFDEPKHFSQFRLLTLNKYSEYDKVSLDKNKYIRLSKSRYVEPGISGYQKLKFYDPLFPEMYAGKDQDNRPRQRAFHDLLTDMIPQIKTNLNPTMRISYDITNDKIKDFNDEDMNEIVKFVQDSGFLNKIILR